MLKFRSVHKDETGATAIEYAVIAACIAMALVGVISLTGNAVTAKFQAVEQSFPDR